MTRIVLKPVFLLFFVLVFFFFLLSTLPMMIQVMIYAKEQLHRTINFAWVFLGLFTDGGGEKALLPKICHT